MPTVSQRPLARDDQAKIWTHLALDNRAAADRLIDRFETRFGTLAQFPLSGRPRAELKPGMRSVVVGHYLIFYEPTESGIDILRVLHGARDLRGIAFD